MDITKLRKFMRRAETVALDSHDTETKVGSVLISKATMSVVSEGFNGFVRGAPDDKLPTTRPDKYQFMQHAEANLITSAFRNGVGGGKYFIVQTLSPCVQCVRMCWQAGITEIYFRDIYRDFGHSRNLGDLQILFTTVGEYYKIELRSAKEVTDE